VTSGPIIITHASKPLDQPHKTTTMTSTACPGCWEPEKHRDTFEIAADNAVRARGEMIERLAQGHAFPDPMTMMWLRHWSMYKRIAHQGHDQFHICKDKLRALEREMRG
jgi:hypothetical protein